MTLMAKQLFSMEKSDFKYAIIGITPFSFQYDESRSGGIRSEQFFMLKYYLTFKDVHHFHVSAESIEQIFNEDFLQLKDKQFSETFSRSNYHNHADKLKVIDLPILMKCRKRAEVYKHRYFPETVLENKKIFFDYLELCQKHNVIPIVTVFPVTKIWREFFPKRLLDEFFVIISEARKKYHFHFIDKLNFDDHLETKDFIDADHINISGARKISKFINDYIMQLENNKN